MARARRSRVELNRARLDEVHGAFADGIFEIARAIMHVAESRAPFGPKPKSRLYHLHEMGGAIVWANGRKVAEAQTGAGTMGRPDKPREFRVRSAPRTVAGVVGFGFPALFAEFGTVHHPAQPFLTPAVQEVIGDAPVILSAAMERRLAGQRSTRTFAIRRRIAAARAAKAARTSSLGAALSAEARRQGY